MIKTWIQSKLVSIIDILDKKRKFNFSVNSVVFVNSAAYVNSAVYVNSNPDTKRQEFHKNTLDNIERERERKLQFLV